MSERLPRVTGKEVVRALGRFGFELHHTRGSHHVLRSADGKRHVTIPVHAGETIGAGLLKRILEHAGIAPEVFREAL